MAVQVPPGFMSLSSALEKQNVDVNVIGVVTDLLLPTRSRGTDWMCSFTISDLTSYGEGIKVRYFRPLQAELPQITGTGDVIVLRNVKSKIWSGMSIFLSTWSSSWAVFQAASIPQSMGLGFVQLAFAKEHRADTPKQPEMRYAISLCNSQDRSSFTVPRSLDNEVAQAIAGDRSGASSYGSKFSLLKDVKMDTFYDVVGQIVKFYPNENRHELYLTDYTSNNLFYNYEWGSEGGGDGVNGTDDYDNSTRPRNRQWRGPFGQMTITVTLWPPHSYFAQSNLCENDFVSLRNVRIKYSATGKLEGCLHTDKRFPDRIDLTKMELADEATDERVKNVLRRKKDYTNRFISQSKDFVDDTRHRQLKEEKQENAKAKKQARRRKKNKQGEKRGEERMKQGRKAKRSTTPQIDNEPDQENIGLTKPLKLELNKHIETKHPTVPTRPLHLILDRSITHATNTAPPNRIPYTLPFQNICSRATVRVVDFFPSNIEDFAISHQISEYDAIADDEDDDDNVDDSQSSTSDQDSSDASNNDLTGNRNKGRRIWTWRFALFLEDHNTRADATTTNNNNDDEKVKVYVSAQDAEFLLNMEACDLRANPTALLELREKLFILWGDLEERKRIDRSHDQVKGKEKGKSTADAGAALRERDANRQDQGVAAGNVHRCPPFTCCIKEYGIRRRTQRRHVIGGEAVAAAVHDSGENGDWAWAWERRFAMFDTTIK
ncbi:hypothetical protein MMC09_004986 [Bachmanniomyces sp. S44760]|nr:hypothetical protein [Bachmanniomyces sp. S44760]